MRKIYGKSQRKLILDHLKRYRTITPVEALHVYKVYRLSSVIERLRKGGYPIKTEMKSDATGTEYGQYVMTMPYHLNRSVKVSSSRDQTTTAVA